MRSTSTAKKTPLWRHIFLILLIVILAFGLIQLIKVSEPEAKREAATKKTAMLVQVEEVSRGRYTPKISGLGTVQPAQEINLSSQVSGEVIQVQENFIPGGFVKKGGLLLKINPVDYKQQVQQKQAALTQAKTELQLEQGRQQVAKEEVQLFDEVLSDEESALVLRKPQGQSAQAAVDAAQADLNMAKTNLARTAIKVPFDAQILSKHANLGTYLTNGDNIAKLVGLDYHWVIATVPVAVIEQINIPTFAQTNKGARVNIHQRSTGSSEQTRQGHVERLIGALDEQTRLARVVIRVPDPLAMKPGATGPKLLIGSVVQVEIEGKPLESVFRIKRPYLRQDNTVWLMRNNKLLINPVTVVFKDKTYAYISKGLEDKDKLVTSNLTSVTPGIGLRTEATQ